MAIYIYMAGVASSLLVYGPLSDGIGRKTPMVIGLVIMAAGSFICLFAGSITLFILGRFIKSKK